MPKFNIEVYLDFAIDMFILNLKCEEKDTEISNLRLLESVYLYMLLPTLRNLFNFNGNGEYELPDEEYNDLIKRIGIINTYQSDNYEKHRILTLRMQRARREACDCDENSNEEEE